MTCRKTFSAFRHRKNRNFTLTQIYTHSPLVSMKNIHLSLDFNDDSGHENSCHEKTEIRKVYTDDKLQAFLDLRERG